MAGRRREPRWLTRLVVDAVHFDQMREHGGLLGIRDENALESALARPIQRWHYSSESDLEALAAAYAFGLIADHPYRDGNKRIGFLALVTFLDINGIELEAPEAEVVTEMLLLAAGQESEDALAAWIRRYARRSG